MTNLWGLKTGAAFTADVDGVLAREVFRSQLVIEEQAVRAEHLLGHSVLAQDVGVTLTADGEGAIGLRATGGDALLLLGKLIH